MGQKPKGGKDGRSELIPRDEPGTEEVLAARATEGAQHAAEAPGGTDT